MDKPDTVIDFLSSRVLKLANTLGLYSSRRYREEFGLTLPEWRCLSVIAYSEPTTARNISRLLATDKGWIGLSTDSLRRRGFVSATPDGRDRRRTLLTLTEEGRKKHEAVLAVATRRQERLLACLPEGAGDLLIECLDRLKAEADRMLEETEMPPRKAEMANRRPPDR